MADPTSAVRPWHMATYHVEAARFRHINRIANRMREIDRVEAGAMGHTPKQALVIGLKGSTLAWTVMADDQPIAMMGVCPVSLIDRKGCPWLLGTNVVSRSKRALLRITPPYLAAMEREFPRLENLVAVANVQSVAWLKRLGFAFDEEIVYVRGIAFQRFHKGF